MMSDVNCDSFLQLMLLLLLFGRLQMGGRIKMSVLIYLHNKKEEEEEEEE